MNCHICNQDIKDMEGSVVCHTSCIEAAGSKPERTSMSEILVCQCGWYGTVDEQDAGGSKNGCCPECGNEDLDFLNEWLQIVQVWRSKLEPIGE